MPCLMTALPRRLAGPLLLALAQPAGATEVYKSLAADGTLAYQDPPCKSGTSELVDFGGATRRGRARLDPACLPIARELWRLNATVNYTDQSAEGRARLRERRLAFAAQCQLRLDRTELATECSQLERAINQATGRGTEAFNRAGEQYDSICSEEAIEADIRRYIKPSVTGGEASTLR